MRFPSLSALVLLFLVPVLATDFESKVEKKMFELVNQERAQRGIRALKWTAGLQQSARKHAERLAENKKLSHQFGDELNVQSRIAATGFHFSASAENVALASDAADLHTALMNSAGHRANILNPNYDSIGIGVMKRDDTYYATQNFAAETEEVSTTDAERRMGAALNRWRHQRGMAAVKVISSARLRSAICSQAEKEKLEARGLFVDSGFLGAAAATTSRLDEIPSSLQNLAGRPNLDRIAIAACFKVTAKYAGGVYWFAFEY